MTKKEKFIEEIKHQLNIDLPNDKAEVFNQKRNVLYTKVEKKHKNILFDYLVKQNLVFEKHLNDYYWIWL